MSMWRELTIDGFRAFEHFELKGLGQINLLVGVNNGGKTSVLEAIHLLSAVENPWALWSVLERWSEVIKDSPIGNLEASVSHLFHGHESTQGRSFSITGVNGAAKEQFHLQITAPDCLAMTWHGGTPMGGLLVSMTPQGSVTRSELGALARHPKEMRRIRFLRTEALDVEGTINLFEEIVLTPEEAVLIEALQTIEPTVERLASVSRGRGGGGKGSLVVKRSGIAQRIPITSMGDGIWRLLGLALALISARNGILLIDEIDTGLHYSVMADMWKLVSRTAARLDVQVFATTHSRDCYESLAAIVRDSKEGEVSIQRIERGQRQAVAFNEREILIAAERGIEVR